MFGNLGCSPFIKSVGYSSRSEPKAESSLSVSQSTSQSPRPAVAISTSCENKHVVRCKKNCHIKPLPPLPSRPRWPLWRDLTESSYFGFITNLHCIGYLPQCKDTYFNAVVSFFKKFFQVRKYVVCI